MSKSFTPCLLHDCESHILSAYNLLRISVLIYIELQFSVTHKTI
jgi:hypothetical protein